MNYNHEEIHDFYIHEIFHHLLLIVQISVFLLFEDLAMVEGIETGVGKT